MSFVEPLRPECPSWAAIAAAEFAWTKSTIRFQAAVWTLVLGGVFLGKVVHEGAMPVFEPNTLALLGISGGAYLGFKIPEKT